MNELKNNHPLDEVFAERFGEKELVASLVKLVGFAYTSDSGGAMAVTKLLLGLYNASEYPFELTELQRLDTPFFEDSLNVIRIRIEHGIEPHEFFNEGGELFKQLSNRLYPKGNE